MWRKCEIFVNGVTWVAVSKKGDYSLLFDRKGTNFIPWNKILKDFDRTFVLHKH